MTLAFSSAHRALRRSVRRRLAPLLALGAAALVGACSEQLDGGATCPALCPVGNAAVRDTVLDVVALDSTLAGFAGPGDAPALLLAVRPGPDSADVRAVVRFDSLPGRFFPSAGGDSLPITAVDSAFLRLRLDTAGTRYTQPVTIEAFDVEAPAGADTAAATLAPLFTAARRLGAVTLQPGTAVDSVRLFLSNAAVAAKTQGTRRLRIGLRVTSAAPATLRVVSARGVAAAEGPRISFDPATDAVYTPLVRSPSSATPGIPEIAAALQDFSFVAVAPRAAAGLDLVVGGAPARRVFMRFVVPRGIVDSTTIVRATLELVQRPARGLARGDTVVVRPEAVLATDTIVDPRRAADFVATPGVLATDSLRLSPADSGQRVFSLVAVVRAWRSLPAGTQRALVLRSAREGVELGEVRFFSREAAVNLRPRLRLSYIPRTEFGLP